MYSYRCACVCACARTNQMHNDIHSVAMDGTRVYAFPFFIIIIDSHIRLFVWIWKAEKSQPSHGTHESVWYHLTTERRQQNAAALTSFRFGLQQQQQPLLLFFYRISKWTQALCFSRTNYFCACMHPIIFKFCFGLAAVVANTWASTCARRLYAIMHA